ncbi:MAG TPA: preprotein translocase subunit SecY, partial [Candidatus Portnoybacteria bacterium]|nr:preprotein translocase subunit SecY [Candidatus Portnoybacteria bacterium]
GFIPGIRPGRPTANFIGHSLNRILFIGATSLGLVAILPNIVRQFTGITTFVLGGTSLLIVVAVILEVIEQIKSQLSMREYE